MYQGLRSVAVGSAPGAALFFVSYDGVKQRLTTASSTSSSSSSLTSASSSIPTSNSLSASQQARIHLAAASCGEVMACLVRVPTDNVKQKMQAGRYTSTMAAVRGVWSGGLSASAPSGLQGFYAGYLTTLARDVPFAMIQFPLYERLRTLWRDARLRSLRREDSLLVRRGEQWDREQGDRERALKRAAELTPVHSALCGSIAGGVAAVLTTPLDVAKTRIMLGADARGVPYRGSLATILRVYQEGAAAAAASTSPPPAVTTAGAPAGAPAATPVVTPAARVAGGVRALFAGVTPRVAWITLGGSVFFGAFEGFKSLLEAAGR